MITIPNIFASLNPATLPVVGGLPALDVSLIDANFAALVAVQSPLVKTSNYAPVQADMNNILVANSGSAIAFTLNTGLTNGSWLWIKNVGSGVLTLTATVDGTSNPTLNQYDEAFVWTDGTYWWGKIFNQYAAALTMVGEANQHGTTSPQTLNLGTVTAGDRIFVNIISAVSSNQADDALLVSIQKNTGTATVNFSGVSQNPTQSVPMHSTGSSYFCTVSAVVEVTGSGTLTLGAYLNAAGTLTISILNIYAFFLKKQ